jgi:UDP-N-acetylmuramoylalanine--D-glutamate ligase
VRSIHLVGEAADELAGSLAGRSIDEDETLERAVAHAAREARPGDVVLLSPACASYDQYESFEHRGDEFRRLVARLADTGD